MKNSSIKLSAGFFFCFLIFLSSFALGQKNNISLIRGTTSYPSWNINGNYSSYNSIIFKAYLGNNQYLQTPVSQSYSSPTTTLRCTLYANYTQDLNTGDYNFNIYAIGADTIVLVNGYMKLTKNVALDPVPLTFPRYTLVALDTPAANNNFIVGMDSDNVWYQKTLAQTRTILGIDTLTGAGNLPDSVVYDSQISDMVTKSTSQTITGQKNFMGTIPIKLNPDTSIGLGGTSNWLGYIKPISLNIKMKDDVPNVHTIFSVTSTDNYTGNFSMFCKEFDFQEGIPGVGLGLYWGYNMDGAKPNSPTISQAFEPNFEPSPDSVDILYEYHWTVQDKAVDPSFSTRPLYLGYAPYNNNRIFMWLAADNLMLMNRNQDINFNFVFDTDAEDSIPHLDIGKSGFIHFTGGTGSSVIKIDRVGSANPVDILSLNGSDEVQLAPYEGARIRLGQGWLAAGEGGNANLSVSGIGTFDMGYFWVRSETGVSRLFVSGAGDLVVGNSFPNFWGTGNVIAARYYATNSASPGAYPDNVILYSTDLSAGNTIPSYYTEGTGVITGNGNIANRYNGTVRYFPSSTSDIIWLSTLDSLDWNLLKNVPAGFADGIDNTGSPGGNDADSLGGQPASAYLLKSDSSIFLTPYDAAQAYQPIGSYATSSHTHTEFTDTLSKSWGVMDTVTTGDYVGWKVDNNITVIEVAAYTNTGTVTFNLEERAEATPNTAGTDLMGSDLVADTDQQETGTFSNATLDRDDWLVPTVTSISGDPTIFTITVRYVKTN